MVARLLGASVVLTEQDELLTLLDRNLDKNFADHPRDDGGIRRAALDWDRKEDTDAVLSCLPPENDVPPATLRSRPLYPLRSTAGDRTLNNRARLRSCVFEPLYGDSWKALAKVMGRLSDPGTTVLCSVERRGVDGVPEFLEACKAEGFSLQMVYRAAPDAPAPVELYEFSKAGPEGFRGVAVAEIDRSSGGGGGADGGESEAASEGTACDSVSDAAAPALEGDDVGGAAPASHEPLPPSSPR
ncbi:unnamed protein product [Scytosiphon promiscuus]